MLLAFGTFWFWALMAGEMLLLLALVECEQSIWATLSLVGMAIALQLFGGWPIWQFILHNPAVIVLGLLVYCLVGTFWCIAKWWLYVRDQKYRFLEAKSAFLRSNRIEGNEIPADKWTEFKSVISYGANLVDLKPQVGDHKARVYLWLCYWPWSFVWTVLNDPVRKIFQNIYLSIRDHLQRISDSVWADVEIPESRR
jgi:hypothetical protein